MTADASPAPRPAPWGILMTVVWTVVTVIALGIASVGALTLWLPDAIVDASGFVNDARTFGVLFIVSVVAEVAVLVAAARLARWRATDYLGLVMPARHEALIAVGAIAVFVLAFDAFTYLVGKPVVTPFQVELYRSAAASNDLPLMWLTLVVAAPVGEEIMFRGFLYRGWAQTQRAVIPAIIVISAFWAIIHTQYDWFGIVQIFLIGLVLGWARWRSGSTLLTIALHGLINAWATLQTFVAINWLNQ
jgi:membrane protease YdiL (CAAX protease family)